MYYPKREDVNAYKVDLADAILLLPESGSGKAEGLRLALAPHAMAIHLIHRAMALSGGAFLAHCR